MKYLFWLSGLNIKADKKIRLVREYITANEVFNLSEKAVKEIPYLTPREKEELLDKDIRKNFIRRYESGIDKNITMISYFDSSYPKLLHNIFDPPLMLYVKGNLPKESEKCAAVVGSRTCSPYGQAMSHQLGSALGRLKVNVISGMALGVDSFAHKGALDAGGKTFAVLGCGVDVIYPAGNRRLYEEILSGGGGIISEYVPGTAALPFYFPNRNRIISGLSHMCIVVEARNKSGSLITADCAIEQGRDVYCIPGRCTDTLSSGCNRLISQGAGIITDIDSFIGTFGDFDTQNDKLNERRIEKMLSDEDAKVYRVLDMYPKDFSQIMLESGLGQTVVMMSIMNLIQNGLARELFKNNYIRNF